MGTGHAGGVKKRGYGERNPHQVAPVAQEENPQDFISRDRGRNLLYHFWIKNPSIHKPKKQGGGYRILQKSVLCTLAAARRIWERGKQRSGALKAQT